MEIIKLKKGFLSGYFETDAKEEKLFSQIIAPNDGKVVATHVNIGSGGLNIRLVLCENTFMWALKGKAYKVKWKDLNIELIEYKSFWKRLLKKGTWYHICVTDKTGEELSDKYQKLCFHVGMVMYYNGVRSVQPNKEATYNFFSYLQNMQKLLLTISGKDKLVFAIKTYDENIKPAKFANIGCQEYLILTNDAIYMVSRYGLKEIKREHLQGLKVKEKKHGILGKTHYVEISLSSGEKLYIGHYSNKKDDTQTIAEAITKWK